MKCSKCKKDKDESLFKQKKDGSYNKQCNDCLQQVYKCNSQQKCGHGKHRNRYKDYKDCRGCSLCEHGLERSGCSQCGIRCKHGKRKQYCKDCGGAAYCEHGRQKYRCKECQCTGICEHGKTKYNCKNCENSTGICEHGRQKNKLYEM